MIHLEAKEHYLQQLKKELKKHPQRESIVQDYEAHLYELVAEKEDEKKTAEEWHLLFSEVIGHPKEVASMWKEELSVTPNKTFYLFLLMNAAFFVAGSLLTFAHLLNEYTWIQAVWRTLTSIPFIIMMLYMGFWAFLGYEIGKNFGARGRPLLKKTFLISVLPNLVLMLLVLFRIIPHEWFHPLLSTTFIMLCIAATILLYPICWIAFRWGKKQSL
ncbi:hypothetical protein M1K46_18585 [Fictibacillus sp. WQ 8-8]|uniref:hypothetical protein n=1 Tax=Fictibacillus sp. WQ 8-8 TaxID=2938788 RepID=UPI00210A322B|nr:hypothetical protein [Fictibacillus sp. WQ 8-8]MCQ6267644.1 hypothetical protein [Fictibacillus sp. WQ 8-8]